MQSFVYRDVRGKPVLKSSINVVELSRGLHDSEKSESS